MTWTDGTTCSVLRDGDAMAEVYHLYKPGDLWTFHAECGPDVGVGVGTYQGRENAKSAAERAIRRMRGEEEECVLD
jgi:hypothetical protein